MYKHVRRIKAALPYEPPGTQARYLKIDLDLDRLTILLGPNASGKTAVLEAIGYTVSGLLEDASSALGITLTTTLRPRKVMPSPIGGTVTLDQTHISNIYIEPTHPLIFKTENIVKDMVHYILGEKAHTLLYEIEKDINRNTLLRLEEIFRRPLTFIHSREEIEETYHILIKLITDALGQDIDVAASHFLRGIKSFRTQEEGIKYILLRRILSIKMLYNLFDNGLVIDRAFILESRHGTVIIRKKHYETIRTPRVAVFHPGFIYWSGVFEGLYYAHIHKGLPNEKESLRILRKYIEWIDGYELILRTLNVKTVDGRRISVYDLSDGQRVAVFMGLLYAISKPPVLFLVDTPEAFVHPDGLPVVADFIARLVAEGNQVIVATQSIEFLEELLVKAKQYKIIDYTSVQRITLTKEGIVKAKGKWSGEISLGSIEELGADLRR